MAFTPRALVLALAPAALGLLAFGGTTACESHGCNALYVPDRVTVERTVPASFDPSLPLQIELCKNEVCESGAFVAQTPSNARLCTTDGSAVNDARCRFTANDDGYAFVATWSNEDAPFHDGDRYRVTLTAGGTTLLNVDATATYTESEPNGEGCGVTKTASL